MEELFRQIIDNPLPSLAIIGNLIIIEGLLSVDNAAVLATMVMDLKPAQRKKALRSGIWGAYIFRGLALLFAAFLIKIWWLKPLGGLYLVYLVVSWWRHRREGDIGKNIDKKGNWLYRATVGSLGQFWATVVLVELMDIAFSIDNVFAAVALSPNIILVCTGVFIGILAMRFIAQGFVKMMEKYPFLETAAYIVIAILGAKLLLGFYEHFYPRSLLSKTLLSHNADMTISALTVAVFFIPVLTCWLFNFPKRRY
jgi:YkoY family integral membrane protein